MVQVDSTTVWLKLVEQLPAIITAIPGVIAAVVAAILAWKSFQQSKMNSVVQQTALGLAQKNEQKTNEISEHVNGMKEQLLKSAEAKGHAEGALDAVAALVPEVPNSLATNHEIPSQAEITKEEGESHERG